MENQITVKFNNQNYLATYNPQSGYYEVDIPATDIGGIYTTEITFTDLFLEEYNSNFIIQILAKEKIEIKTNKVFMWIFDYKDFSVKDIVEISSYEINIDEETNSNSSTTVLKRTTAKSRDLVAIKKNNEIIYWGIIDNIQNTDGETLYTYTLKYITNIFDAEIPLNKNINEKEIPDGVYRIKTCLDTNKVIDVKDGSVSEGAKVQIWGNNDTEAQKWQIKKQTDGSYSISCLKSQQCLDITDVKYENGNPVQQWSYSGAENQKWLFENLGKSLYKIKSYGNQSYNLDVEGGSLEEGTEVQIYTWNNTDAQKFYLELLKEYIIKNTGIEDFIANAIEENFLNSEDSFTNLNYIEIKVKTHTPLQTTVTNVNNGIYNLHTWMSNCTQLYNIIFTFYIENGKLILEIENKTLNKEIIDVNAQPISNYAEVFETDVVSKVVVLTDTDTYTLYLLNDRTTTTDGSDTNRAEGKVETIYTANYEDAEQKALDTIKANSYNHNITFSYYNRYIPIGTPIAIKTKESLIYDTYISAIKIAQNKFIEYTCGNIRINFIDKLLKERSN